MPEAQQKVYQSMFDLGNGYLFDRVSLSYNFLRFQFSMMFSYPLRILRHIWEPEARAAFAK